MHLEGRELRVNMSGDDVATLHRELRQIGFTIPKDESDKRRFGKGTREAVRKFQGEHDLDQTGEVDQRTANLINREVEGRESKKLVISGQVHRADDTPIVGALVRAFEAGSADAGDILGEAKTGLGGAYRLEWKPEKGSDGTDIQVRAFNEDGRRLAESDILRGVRQDLTVNLTVGAPEPKKLVISGQVRQADETAVVGALVKAFKVGSPGDGDILGEAKTGLGGAYRLEWKPEKGSQGTDLQVRAFREDGRTLLAESEVLRGVSFDLTVNLTVRALDYVVSGQVRRADGSGPVAQATVKAFDLDEQNAEKQLGQTETNDDGRYRIEYRSAEADGPDVRVRAFASDGASLAASPVFPNVGTEELVVDLLVEKLVDGDFVVKGVVRGADGTVLVGTTVKAFDKDMRHEELLGEKATDQAGRYEIRYGREQFRRAEKESADLLVRALDSNDELLVASPIIFNARQVEEVDLMVGGGQFQGSSEYELLVAELAPVVGDVVPFAQLNEDDVTFLAGETGQGAERIAFFARAHLLAGEDVGVPERVPAEAFYGMFRQNLPTELAALLAQSRDVQQRALEAAVAENIIPMHFGDQIEDILDWLAQLIPGQIIEEPLPGSGVPAKDLLGTTLEDEGLQQQFASEYAAHTGPIEEFWKNLRETPEFEGHVEDLQFTLQLGALTGNHLPLVKELQGMRSEDEGEIATVRDLASFDAEKWSQIISDPDKDIGVPPGVPGENNEEKVRNYASALAGVVEDAFPTSFVTRRLEREISGEADLLTSESEEEASGRQHLLTFFQNNEESFDYAGTRLQSYLAENPGALDPIPEENRLHVQQQVGTMQRLYRVAPRDEKMQVLMDDGLHSAQDITLMGQTAFAIEYAGGLGGEAEAQRVYQNAEHVTSTAMAFLADFGMASKCLPMAAVPDTAPEEVAGIPDWKTLFGSLDLCACEHCRSVYSPAAYLVDVLHFLKDRQLVETTAKDVLFARRRDLGEIELTCENTNVPVPYVDLVNEVMEDFVAPPGNLLGFFFLGAEQIAALDERKLSKELREAISPELSEHATAFVEEKGERWRIEDLAFSYAIRRDIHPEVPGEAGFVTRGRHTRGTPQERAANPQYVNQGAYAKLRRQVFPWQLPFDLWAEEARAYLEHLGVRRHEVMETFWPGDRPAMLDHGDVAREYLGFTPAEADIVTGATRNQPDADSPGVWNLWGFDAELLEDGTVIIPDPANSDEWIDHGRWLDVLGRVDVFLQQSGLEYQELLDAYALKPLFVGRDGQEPRIIRDITLQSPDSDTCDLSSMLLEGLSRTAAGLIARCIRLWRKSGWSMWDLHGAYVAFRSTSMDDFLMRLSHVERLREALNLPVEKLLSFWAPINTAHYVDHDTDGPTIMPSLYDRLFRNKAVINPPDPAFIENPADLAGTLTLTEHVPAITAALNQNQVSDELRQGLQNHQKPLSSAASVTTLTADARWQIVDAETGSVYVIVRDNQDLSINFRRTLSKRAATISAALGISAADFTLLLNDENVIPRIPDPADPANDKLTLDNLSRLHRHATLARALRLPVREYLSVLELDGDPFSTTAQTVLFVERVNKIRASGFSLDELGYAICCATIPSPRRAWVCRTRRSRFSSATSAPGCKQWPRRTPLWRVRRSIPTASSRGRRS